jgi:NADPH:quinone reductase-like Zn-dependent oxidoreductase
MQYYTAYGGLIGCGKVKRGDYVLITAATGSMGVSSIQITKMAGGISIVTTRSADKVDWLKGLGADHVIVTSKDGLATTVKEITKEHGGVDVIFDPIAGDALNVYAEIATPGGQIVLYGALSGAPTPFPLFPALAKGLTIRGYTLFELSRFPESENFKEATAFIRKGLESGDLMPDIGHTFDFDKLKEALEFLDSGKVRGKVVVKISAAL